ncbi:hypothetical protein EJ07DRAFT_153624 [Lizonia empirigonia]|nr:hypothetical protein EJ07DRAFT_153624 [Lizonia empirigonia]
MADNHQRIVNWLRHAEKQACGQDLSNIGESDTIEPVTPPRRRHLLQYYDELSPTSTNFSSGDVFDNPETPDESRNQDVFCDDASEATSVEDHELSPRDQLGEQRTQPRFVKSADGDNIYSYDPLSEVGTYLEVKHDNLCESPNRVLPPVDPDRPRITCITSCTQCILADLPCSRTIPYCYRCKRKGQAGLCLLHRRKFPEEIERCHAELCTTPVLLKLKGEDETNWNEKLKIAEKLNASWRTEEDRRNWVLPSIDGPRGDFGTYSTHLPRNYAGEGKGQLMFRELHVVIEE